MDGANPRGQTLHSALYRDERIDPACDGVVRAAYVRQLIDGTQRWIRIGEHCDGCHSFWPGARRASYRQIERRESAERRAVTARWERDPRRAPKYSAGRNDLCPCGSGLKFKRCHGV